MPDVKKIAFTFITIFLVPLLFFGLLEFGLFVLGVGKSYDYFEKVEIDGRTYFQENVDFADQFYPASLDISPRETTFATEHRPERLRVFILGGSAALGFPHKNHGLDRLLATQLKAALPSREVEVINTAMTSVNSHVVYAVANEIPDESAEFAVILMGNNEVVGPYGPGTFSENFLGNITLIRGIQALKRTRIWQALNALVLTIRPTDAMEELEWEGMQMFANRGVSHDDPRMEDVYRHYEANLASIIRTLRSKGVHVILSSVPVNLRNSAPFLSLHRPTLSEEELNRWREHTRRGAQSADDGNWDDAVSNFRAAIKIDPEYADTHFRLAGALENLGEFREAGVHYRRALDLDALRFRADTRINQIIQHVADDSAGAPVSFVDSAGAFEAASEPLQPGWNLLLEHVHYSFAGNHVLAAEVARSIVRSATTADDYEPLPATEIARRVGFPNHDSPAEIGTLQAMIEHPPFPGQSNYVDLAAFLDDKREVLAAAVGSPMDVIRRRRDLVESGLADWKIHFELAVLNERLRNSSAMYYHLNKILELYPHNRETYIKLAEAKSREGKWREAIPYLERSLYYTRGDEKEIAETTGWLGTAYLRTGEYEKATGLLNDVIEEFPDQVGSVLRAYGTLVRYSRERGRKDDLERYIRGVQRYGRSLVRSGKDERYPDLNQTMSRILMLGGYTEEAREWAEAT